MHTRLSISYVIFIQFRNRMFNLYQFKLLTLKEEKKMFMIMVNKCIFLFWIMSILKALNEWYSFCSHKKVFYVLSLYFCSFRKIMFGKNAHAKCKTKWFSKYAWEDSALLLSSMHYISITTSVVCTKIILMRYKWVIMTFWWIHHAVMGNDRQRAYFLWNLQFLSIQKIFKIKIWRLWLSCGVMIFNVNKCYKLHPWMFGSCVHERT